MTEGTSASMVLAAPRSAVMAVIADIEAYPEWNAEIGSTEVLDTAPDGRPGRVRFTVDAGPIRDTYVLGYDWSGDDAVRWHLEQGGVLTAMDGGYRLVEAGADTTEVTYDLTVELTMPMLSILRRKGERMIVDRALAGLSARVASR